MSRELRKGVVNLKHYVLVLMLAVSLTSLAGCSSKSSDEAYQKGVAEAQEKWSAETVVIDEEKKDKLAENVAKNRKDYEKKLSEVDNSDGVKEYNASKNANGDMVDSEGKVVTYILNISTGQFHNPSCSLIKSYSVTSLRNYYLTRSDALAAGYQACVECKP